MTDQTLPLVTFYSGWETFQQSLLETVEPLSSDQLALPTAPHHWSIEGVVHHIIGARAFWFQRWMGEGNPDLAHWDDDGQPVHDAAQLVAGLETTWHMIADALARWTPADLGHVCPTPPGQDFSPRTRQWIIWHVLEHEIYHVGELSLALGGIGREGVYGKS